MSTPTSNIYNLASSIPSPGSVEDNSKNMSAPSPLASDSGMSDGPVSPLFSDSMSEKDQKSPHYSHSSSVADMDNLGLEDLQMPNINFSTLDTSCFLGDTALFGSTFSETDTDMDLLGEACLASDIKDNDVSIDVGKYTGHLMYHLQEKTYNAL